MNESISRLDIAVIGTGIAGLSAAWLLESDHHVTVYEAASRAGGHSNTVEVRDAAGAIAVDTGFIVYNEATYPNLTALLRYLGVATQASDMGFAVSLDGGRLEYAGNDLGALFAQKSNVLRPRFWAMLRDLQRFYREAPAAAIDPDVSIGDWLDAAGYGAAFQEDHLFPMAAAIWSATAMRLRDYPAASFIKFCENHGLLKLRDRPVWRTVRGGSQHYVRRLTDSLGKRLKLGLGARAIRREPGGVFVRGSDGVERRYDHVVIATHADQARGLLEDPTELEAATLGAFTYTRNLAVLHEDAALMPRRRRAWSSWNYLGGREGQDQVSVTYWMNRLQPLPTARTLFVTLNPRQRPAEGSILHEEIYQHPQFDAAALRAQRHLWALQGVRRTWFCGAYFGAGFHEDGLQSGLAVAEQVGGRRRPWTVANESGRLHLPGFRPDLLCRAA